MVEYFLTSILFFASLFSLQAHAADTLKVAISPWYFPVVFENSEGNTVGIDIDVANLIAKKVGANIEFIVMPREKIGAAVAQGNADLGISAIEERSYLRGNASAHVDSSKIKLVPYYDVPAVFVVRDKNIDSLEKLKSKNIGTLSYFASRSTLADWSKSGLVGKTFGLESEIVLTNNLKLNRLDGILVTLPTALELIAKSNGSWHKLELKDPKKFIREPLAIVLPTEKSDRQKKISDVLDEIRESKKLSEISAKWIDLP